MWQADDGSQTQRFSEDGNIRSLAFCFQCRLEMRPLVGLGTKHQQSCGLLQTRREFKQRGHTLAGLIQTLGCGPCVCFGPTCGCDIRLVRNARRLQFELS